MRTPDLPLNGSCRCGGTRLRISAQPLLTSACHCRGCQKMSASAFSLSVAIPARGFQVLSGSPVIGGLHNPELRHYFCPACLSWLFTRFQPEFVNVRVTLLDDASWFVPFMETWTAARLPWATTPAVHSYEGFPPLEAYPHLLRQFQQWLDAPPS